MKYRVLISLFVMIVVSVFMVSVALADCPEGKNPVQITTPSGMVKTLCIPDAAMQGIENAAENSGGTIVASSCPCFTTSDIQAVDSVGTGLTCSAFDYIDQYGNLLSHTTSCVGDGGKLGVWYHSDPNYTCAFRNSEFETSNADMTESEYDSCLSILDAVLGPIQ